MASPDGQEICPSLLHWKEEREIDSTIPYNLTLAVDWKCKSDSELVSDKS
jgi:hypothetical protein